MDEKTRARFFAKTKVAEEIRPGMSTPCLEWTAGCSEDGYGRFRVEGALKYANRVAWELEYGYVPVDLCVCHRCDNPSCVATEHLFLGTVKDNMDDMAAKGRKVVSRGDSHWTRLHPERLARGSLNGANTHPESRARGDDHWARLRPELRCQGESHGRSKLTEEDVRNIFKAYFDGKTQQQIAVLFKVGQTQVSKILARKLWSQVAVDDRLLPVGIRRGRRSDTTRDTVKGNGNFGTTC